MSQDPVRRTVSWTETATIGCGFHECAWCGCSTPEPSDSVVASWAKRQPGSSWLWPASDDQDGWHPPGWRWADGELLCPFCERDFSAAVSTAKAKRKPAP